MTCIIGLDPGLCHTGWGVICFRAGHLTHVAHGIIHPQQKISLAERL